MRRKRPIHRLLREFSQIEIGGEKTFVGAIFEHTLILLIAILCFGYVMGQSRAKATARLSGQYLASRPDYYGWFCVLGGLLPFMAVGFVGWFFPVQEPILRFILPITALLGVSICLFRVNYDLPAQVLVEQMVRLLLLTSAIIASLATIAIIVSLLFETGRFFSFDNVSVIEFFFGREWSIQSEAAFGALPLFFGTIFIAFMAITFAAPIGFFAAIFLSEYASPTERKIIKPFLELLAGVPTVVYGVFALTVVAPFMRDIGDGLNALLQPISGGKDLIPTQPKNALSASLVLGVMIIPLITSLSDDVLRAVPSKMRNAALGLGATQSELLKHVVLPSAFPGLVGTLLLAVSRAFGETMIVVMAVGDRAHITLNPFEDVTTVTAQIVSTLTGDPEFNSAKTLSAFALGAVLFGVTLAFNILAQWIVHRQEKRFDTA